MKLLSLLLIAVLKWTSALECLSTTPTTVSLVWDEIPNTDGYYVSILNDFNETVTLQVAEEGCMNATIDYLKEGTKYLFQLRSHDSSYPSVVWGWRNESISMPMVSCSTSVSDKNYPYNIIRVGHASLSEISLQWNVSGSRVFDKFNITYRSKNTKKSLHQYSTESSTTLVSLNSGDTYFVSVDGSEEIKFKTTPDGVTYTEMYRVSEYIYEVDFLPNHNSADLEGQVAFLTTNNNNDFFNKFNEVPISRYCVEHSSTPFADYVSCNGPEGAPRNIPSDPICICECYADRLISLQNATEMNATCDQPIFYSNNTHSNPTCRCGARRSKWVLPKNSDKVIGRGAAFLPYFYYQQALDSYTNVIPFGNSFSTPKGGECFGSSIPSEGLDCQWKSPSRIDVIHGRSLLNLGWNNSIVHFWPMHPHGPNTTAKTLQNKPVFEKAWQELQHFITPRCCGC